MRRPLVAALAAALTLSVLSPLSSSFAATAKVGAKCSKVGAKASASGKQLVCAPNKKWALVKAAPTPAPKPTPTPTPTAVGPGSQPEPPVTLVTRPADLPATRSMQRVRLNESCHSQVSATLQRLEGGSWVNIADAQGWDRIPSCPDSNPYLPWTNASVAVGETLRWKVFSPGNWEWFSSSYPFRLPIPPVEIASRPDAPLTDFASIALKGRDAVLSSPVFEKPNAWTIKYEPTIPPNNKSTMEETAAKTMKFLSYFLPSALVFRLVVFGSSAWGYETLTGLDPTNEQFKKDMKTQFTTWGDRPAATCSGAGGFSLGFFDDPVLAIDAPCAKWDEGSYSVVSHEIVHSVQSKFGQVGGPACIVPIWWVEGQAQAVGFPLAQGDGKSRWYVARRSAIIRVHDPLQTPLSAAESANDDVQYTNGAAAMEYLIARSGLLKSFQVIREANRIADNTCPGEGKVMPVFRQAFKNVYGQTVDDFYAEVLPYLQWVYNNKSSL